MDDSDSYVCRPHAPGEIRDALIGRTLTGAFRRGKTMWCETSGVGRSRRPGPVLGLHLGMSGHILITKPGAPLTEGGDWMNGRYDRLAATGKDLTRWDRFMITYADGGTLRLFDPRRLGRVRLDPHLDDLGPDAALLSAAEFAERVGGERPLPCVLVRAAGVQGGPPPSGTKSRAPIKARLLDQSVIAGVGNLLADEILWQARISPRRPSNDLSRDRIGDLAPGRAECGAVGDRQGWIAHRDHDRLPQGRAPLPALRRRADPSHRRRPYDVVVSARAAMSSSS